MEKSEVKEIINQVIKKRIEEIKPFEVRPNFLLESHLTVYFNSEKECQEVKELYPEINLESTPDKKGLLIPMEFLTNFL